MFIPGNWYFCPFGQEYAQNFQATWLSMLHLVLQVTHGLKSPNYLLSVVFFFFLENSQPAASSFPVLLLGKGRVCLSGG